MRKLDHLVALIRCELDGVSKLKYLLYRTGALHWDRERWKKTPRLISLRLKSGRQCVLRRGTTDILVFQEMFLERQYFRAAAALGLKANDPSVRRVLDAGANVGLAALVFRELFPAAEICCVEPEEGNFEILQRSAKHLGSVQLIRGFIGSQSGWGYVCDAGRGEWGFSLSRTRTGLGSRLCIWTMSELLDSLNWPEVDLVKLDIEGTEEEVLAASQDWITRSANLIVEIGISPDFQTIAGHCASVRQDVGGEHIIWAFKYKKS